MKNTIISIVIPCYNAAQYLEETLVSVHQQLLQEWECIIVDDGSTDNTCEIAQRYCDLDARFKLLQQPNGGPSKARNLAIAHAQGKYILPLDSDDLIAPSYTQKAVNYLEQHNEVAIVYCRVRNFGQSSTEWDLPAFDKEKQHWFNQLPNASVFRKAIYNQTQGYDEAMRGGFEDWDFWLRMLKVNDHVHQLDEVLHFYRVREVSRNTEACEKACQLMVQMYHNHPDLYADSAPEILYYRNQALMLEGESASWEAAYRRLLHSRAYRLGNLLLAPLRLFKK